MEKWPPGGDGGRFSRGFLASTVLEAAWSNWARPIRSHPQSGHRDFWLEEWEKQALLDFYREHPLEGYRRLTFMMLDADIVAVSPSSVWRVLSRAGLLRQWNGKASQKGTGFQQPPEPHQHWHIDVSYINISGTFYYLCSVLDGYSRAIVHGDLREAMREADVEIILEAAKEKYPQAQPRLISDNGPQFVAKDFKEFIRLSGMTHVRTSPYYPQSNDKLERGHKSLKNECMRPGVPLTPEDARRLIERYVEHYNTLRWHSAIGFVTPADMLAGRPKSRDVGAQRATPGRSSERDERFHGFLRRLGSRTPFLPCGLAPQHPSQVSRDLINRHHVAQVDIDIEQIDLMHDLAALTDRFPGDDDVIRVRRVAAGGVHAVARADTSDDQRIDTQ